jgi:hypothetical protein
MRRGVINYSDPEQRRAYARTRARLPGVPASDPRFRRELTRQLERKIERGPPKCNWADPADVRRYYRERERLQSARPRQQEPAQEWDDVADDAVEPDRAALAYDPPSAPDRALLRELSDFLARPKCEEARIAELAAPDRIGDVAKCLRHFMPTVSGWRVADCYRHLTDRFNGKVRLQRLLLEFGVTPEEFRAADPRCYIVIAALGEIDWPAANASERAAYVIGRIAAHYMRARGFA